jgi:hypothetical protein
MEEFEKAVEKYWFVNTGHITQQDNEILRTIVQGAAAYEHLNLHVEAHEYGYWVNVSSDNNSHDIGLYHRDLLDAGLSTSFCSLLKIAFNLGCIWMNLDCDGWTYKTLNQYDW